MLGDKACCSVFRVDISYSYAANFGQKSHGTGITNARPQGYFSSFLLVLLTDTQQPPDKSSDGAHIPSNNLFDMVFGVAQMFT
jgi:hypothetical protein